MYIYIYIERERDLFINKTDNIDNSNNNNNSDNNNSSNSSSSNNYKKYPSREASVKPARASSPWISSSGIS